MQRTLLLLGASLTLTSCLNSAPRNAADACEIFEDNRAWFRAAADAEKRWGVPISVSMAFIYQESAFRSRAKPARTRILWVIPGPRPSNAYGYAQALESTWNEYREVTGNTRAKRSNFADAVDFIGWYNANSYRRNNIAPHDARNLYLAYHEGNTGFARRTYADKAWLLETADRVQSNADRYQSQIDRCADELGKNWWQRLFF
ncbi:MAG: transglycosylase SLT domain-containing protein [Pseudomonadales bacterium]|nr:transglycosylase SLT domain-containing protein [Pseudomonadales bacterium]